MVICSCLPPLQPLVTRVFPGLLGSVSHSRGHANKYNGYPNFGFNEHESGPHSSVSASRSKDRAHRMDAITITQELRLESSDHQYAATGETDSERGLVLQDLTQKAFVFLKIVSFSPDGNGVYGREYVRGYVGRSYLISVVLVR